MERFTWGERKNFFSSLLSILLTEKNQRESCKFPSCQINTCFFIEFKRKMPIPLDRIKAVEDEMERERDAKAKNKDDDDHDHHHHQFRHTTAMTPPDQDFSFLTNPRRTKRAVHYDIEPSNDPEYRPLRTLDTEQPLDNVLRRRYIAHWGLPGTFFIAHSRSA